MTITNRFTEFAGELACIDVYTLPKPVMLDENEEYYLLGIIDSCTQIVWVELIEDTEPLTIMFGALKCFRIFSDYYSIKFREVLSDKSLGMSRHSKGVLKHPFSRLLKEMDIVHRQTYSNPYILLTSERIKEFWGVMTTDMLNNTRYTSPESLKEKIVEYLYYYNEKRVHQNLGGMTPNEFNKICPRVV